jgi:predicted glycogen debranching enzyme
LETIFPKIHLNRDVLSDFDKAIQTEWIITNGLGGYSSSTVLGVNTRKYHGLLVAAFNPPTDRRVLLAKLDEDVKVGNRTYRLGANEFKKDIFPKGFESLDSFSLNPFPKYKYVVNGVQVEKTLFMPYGDNTVAAVYDVSNPNEDEVLVNVFPLVNSRHFHSLTDRDKLGWSFIQEHNKRKVMIQTSAPLSTLLLYASDGHYFAGKGDWIKDLYYRADAALGYDCVDSVFLPGRFEFEVAPNEKKRFHILGVADEKEPGKFLASVLNGSVGFDVLYERELTRLKGLLEGFHERYADMDLSDWLKWFILAADSFIVNRKSVGGKSVIAGYHWFEDWGRDSLISLPGLTLVTGRFDYAREILLTFEQYCHGGVVPNRFPDHSGDKPEYNTVDASLWFFNAVLQFVKYTDDFEFVRRELWDTLVSMVEYHIKGTAYGIHVDSDGLLVHGPQLTWMDAVIDNRAVTPRDGKAVEIQALWYNALKTMEFLAKHFGELKLAEEYTVLAEKVKKSFIEEFWDDERGYLCDVVKGDSKDWCLRPNQVIATALDFCMLDREKAKRVVGVVHKKLWGRFGLKTLSSDAEGCLSPLYIGRYVGDWASRNKAYHNGTVWAWLTGPFVTSFIKVHDFAKVWCEYAFDEFLKPLFTEELYRAGLGTISEVFDGDEPHQARGCISQAWSIAEPLRTYIENIIMKRPTHEKALF